MTHDEADPYELLADCTDRKERIQKARDLGLLEYVAQAEDWDADIEYELSREGLR